MSAVGGLNPENTSKLLVDTNLLVLFIVGTVNRNRIETFKRTSKYTRQDYDLLVRVLDSFKQLYTVAHVLSEVSNLTDLQGFERQQARQVLKATLTLLSEADMPSIRAGDDPLYDRLGLTDGAIGAVARKHSCAVLTDDLDLYLLLSRDTISVINFTHLRAREMGV
jgi:rRNA-processing protein FCF1